MTFDNQIALVLSQIALLLDSEPLVEFGRLKHTRFGVLVLQHLLGLLALELEDELFLNVTTNVLGCRSQISQTHSWTSRLLKSLHPK